MYRFESKEGDDGNILTSAANREKTVPKTLRCKVLGTVQFFKKLLGIQAFFVLPNIFLISPSVKYLRVKSIPNFSFTASMISSV